VVVIGAPGTGKTTFTNALQQFVGQLDRKHAIVNLDPANENIEYKVSQTENESSIEF
jgi:GTPase SAR1 family protein